MNDRLRLRFGIPVVEMTNSVLGPAIGGDPGVGLIRGEPQIGAMQTATHDARRWNRRA